MTRNRYIIIANAPVTLENLGNVLGHGVIERNEVGNVGGLPGHDDEQKPRLLHQEEAVYCL